MFLDFRLKASFGTALLLFMATACGSDSLLGPDAAQGIDGLALLGPQCPVQTTENPCPDEPHQAWITVRSSGGDEVTRIRSGEDGRFRVGLRPGQYTLEPEAGNPFPAASDENVLVEEGVFTAVTISFDTGIR